MASKYSTSITTSMYGSRDAAIKAALSAWRRSPIQCRADITVYRHEACVVSPVTRITSDLYTGALSYQQAPEATRTERDRALERDRDEAEMATGSGWTWPEDAW